MRKTREVLWLYFDLKLGQRQVARSTNISQSTVHGYLERFTAARLNWPLPAEITEAELEAALFPVDPGKDREPTTVRPVLRQNSSACSSESGIHPCDNVAKPLRILLILKSAGLLANDRGSDPRPEVR